MCRRNGVNAGVHAGRCGIWEGRVGVEVGSGDLRVEVGWSRGIVTLDSRREDDTMILCLQRISVVVAATLPRVLLAMTTC